MVISGCFSNSDDDYYSRDLPRCFGGVVVLQEMVFGSQRCSKVLFLVVPAG